MAVRNGSAADRASVLAKIRDFNRAWPQIAIDSASLNRGISGRARYSAQAENGVMLNKRLRGQLVDRVTPWGDQ